MTLTKDEALGRLAENGQCIECGGHLKFMWLDTVRRGDEVVVYHVARCCGKLYSKSKTESVEEARPRR